ncbi:MAG: hypothetical protein EXR71_10955 [Myxococcales bacterium]|nr:hypothetical protein [Myxococcales bacterium]
MPPFDPYAELIALTRALDEAGLDYALCGGLALAVYGAPRATRDIDLLVSPAQLDEIRAVARSLGYTYAALPMRLTSGITLWRLTRLVGVHPLMLDLMLLPEGLTAVFDARIRVAVEGGSLQVVTRDGLIVLKTTAGRPQDLVDIQRLMELEHE